jgi:hypothetical protein
MSLQKISEIICRKTQKHIILLTKKIAKNSFFKKTRSGIANISDRQPEDIILGFGAHFDAKIDVLPCTLALIRWNR